MGDLPDGSGCTLAPSVVYVMMMIATALVAAVLYGAGAAVEQRQAAAAPESSAGRPRLLFLLACQPLWLLGLVAQIGGFAAHAAALRSGMVWVNCYKRVNPGSPFGGTGKSGYGREMGFAAMDEYTTRKSVWINVDAKLPDWYAR